ncbi:5'-nucleotidase [Lyngbya aestuarii BL J]|uniref:5'-nucleotidase n=1 Tax=Lyngbya aestuarii BL J TaxID=1348334 RepID=U7QA52_9CYAN|nr:5'-nucleotidase C-terminal domain-containing protein [Lyngbya aestuarii]ERT04062.1 5'-nucleotidase [Lyngbya aestuarii BL J]
MKWKRRTYIVLFLWTMLMSIALHNAVTRPQEFSLRVLHTNDHHAHLEAVEGGETTLGGIAQRKTLIDSLRSEDKAPTLVLDAGDIFQGTLYFNKYLGEADLPFYNQLNYAAVAVGNHEFDKGQQVLADFIKQAKFPMVSANIDVAPNSPLSGLIKPWIVQEVKGQKIGILGLTTAETALLSSPGEGVVFTPEVEAAQKAVTALQKQGVNKIIALTHLGFSNDKELARKVDGIDIIIGGHSHTPLGNMPGATEPYPVVEKTPNGETVLLVTDWEWGKYLGDLQVSFDPKGHLINWQGSPHAVDGNIKADETFIAQLDEFKQPLDDLRQQVVGKTTVKLDGDRANIRTQETNLGNLIADAILDKMRVDNGQISIVNGGGIRASIPAGEVTVGQVLEVLPFGNTVTRLDLTGTQLKQALEHGVSQVEQGDGSFPHVSGIRLTWNPKAPAGSRIVSVQVRDQNGKEQPLDLNATYRVVTNDFMMGGGDGYKIFEAGENQVDTGFLLADVVIDYIRNQSPLNLKAENRIVPKNV